MRKQFFLILSHNPKAVDIVREDFLVTDGDTDDILVGDEVVFLWEKKKDKVEHVPGTVLMIGLKKEVSAVKVNAEGEIQEGDDFVPLGTKKQEEEKRRIALNSAKELNLQNVAEGLLQEGADALCKTLAPVVPKKRLSLPKKRPVSIRDQIKAELKAMPCFSPIGVNKGKLYGDNDVYVNLGALTLLKLKYRKRPKDLHREVLKLCIPEDILRLDGVSASGKRGCEKIDPIINEVVGLYVTTVYAANGGDILKMQYDPDEILTNLLDNTKREKGKRLLLPVTEDPAEHIDQPMDTNTGTSSAEGDAAVSASTADHEYTPLIQASAPQANQEIVLAFRQL